MNLLICEQQKKVCQVLFELSEFPSIFCKYHTLLSSLSLSCKQAFRCTFSLLNSASREKNMLVNILVNMLVGRTSAVGLLVFFGAMLCNSAYSSLVMCRDAGICGLFLTEIPHSEFTKNALLGGPLKALTSLH